MIFEKFARVRHPIAVFLPLLVSILGFGVASCASAGP